MVHGPPWWTLMRMFEQRIASAVRWRSDKGVSCITYRQSFFDDAADAIQHVGASCSLQQVDNQAYLKRLVFSCDPVSPL
jgi:hypothetical protein